jgi:hypothetical protein
MIADIETRFVDANQVAPGGIGLFVIAAEPEDIFGFVRADDAAERFFVRETGPRDHAAHGQYSAVHSASVGDPFCQLGHAAKRVGFKRRPNALGDVGA